ncbi:TPA: hypothetical protein AB5A43_000039 [Vibrio cholerae]
MQYAAILVTPDGGFIRHQQTKEVANILIGDFDSFDDAINQACQDLNCQHLNKGEGKGGFMVVTTQDLEAV